MPCGHQRREAPSSGSQRKPHVAAGAGTRTARACPVQVAEHPGQPDPTAEPVDQGVDLVDPVGAAQEVHARDAGRTRWTAGLHRGQCDRPDLASCAARPCHRRPGRRRGRSSGTAGCSRPVAPIRPSAGRAVGVPRRQGRAGGGPGRRHRPGGPRGARCEVRRDRLARRCAADQGPGYTLRVVVAELVGGEPVPHEHDAVRWLGPEELDDVDWLGPDLPFLDELRGQAAGRSPARRRQRRRCRADRRDRPPSDGIVDARAAPAAGPPGRAGPARRPPGVRRRRPRPGGADLPARDASST